MEADGNINALAGQLRLSPLFSRRERGLTISSFSVQSYCPGIVLGVCQQSLSFIVSLAKSLIPGYLCYPFHSFGFAFECRWDNARRWLAPRRGHFRYRRNGSPPLPARWTLIFSLVHRLGSFHGGKWLVSSPWTGTRLRLSRTSFETWEPQSFHRGTRCCRNCWRFPSWK